MYNTDLSWVLIEKFDLILEELLEGYSQDGRVREIEPVG